MASSSLNTLLRTMEWAKKLNFGRSSAIGNFLEPAMTSANTVMQTILGPPFIWRWNRVVTGFITTPGQQDYTIFNWTATSNVKLGWVLVDNNGNCQQVTTAGATGSSLPTWNTTTGQQTVDGGAHWTNLGPIGTATSATYSMGFIEHISVQDTQNGSSKWFEMTNEIGLALDSAQARPRYLSAEGDDGNGNITFRLMPVPDKAYPIAITLQQKPAQFTSVNQTWAPIPDEYARIYNWGFLSLMWLFAADPRFSLANQKFVAQLLSTAEGLDETQRNIFLQGWSQNTGQPVSNADKMQQGYAARGI